MKVRKVISGGQTGVDRAGLDAAIESGIEHGGYAPKGRKAEDGIIPEKYKMKVLERGGYPARTKKNIESSDGTLVFCQGKPSTGTKLTVDYADEIEKPCLVLDLDREIIPTAIETVRVWIEKEKIEVMNVAGPRLSSAPILAMMAKKILLGVFNK